jgi:hypothetical protein
MQAMLSSRRRNIGGSCQRVALLLRLVILQMQQLLLTGLQIRLQAHRHLHLQLLLLPVRPLLLMLALLLPSLLLLMLMLVLGQIEPQSHLSAGPKRSPRPSTGAAWLACLAPQDLAAAAAAVA